MTASDVLTESGRLGIQLTVAANGKLHVRAPRGVLTSELHAGLETHRNELLLRCQACTVNLDVPGSPGQKPGRQCAKSFPAPGRLNDMPDGQMRRGIGQANAYPDEFMRRFAWLLDIEPDDLPVEPFSLGSGLTVTDRVKFLRSLQRDLEHYPKGARSLSRALQQDCEKLAKLISKS